MKLSIITITHNSKKHLNLYIDSFLKKHIFLTQKVKNQIEIIFIENSGQDITLFREKMIKNGFNTTVINTKNKGFGAACNVGSKHAKGEKLVFINPDVIFRTSIFPNKELENNYFGTCLQFNNSLLPHSFDLLPENKNLICELSLFIKLINLLFLILNIYPRIFFPIGSFLFIDKKIFDDIGMFNEQFFLYYEEADFTKRIYEKYKLNFKLIRKISIQHNSFGSHNTISESQNNESLGFITYCKIATNKELMSNQLRRLKILKLISKGAKIKYYRLLHNSKKQII